jgi:hypothetical protein
MAVLNWSTEVNRINTELRDLPMGADETMIVRRAISYACDGCGTSLPGEGQRFECIEVGAPTHNKTGI